MSEQKIRTLGLYQPYASLMLHGKIETRWVMKGKKPPFPIGQYLIYSTKKAYDLGEFKILAADQYHAAMEKLDGETTRYMNGYGLCVADLVKLENWSNEEKNWEAFSRTFVNMVVTDPEYDRWLLHFENVRRIKPLSFKGKQGIGFLSAEDEAKIEYV